MKLRALVRAGEVHPALLSQLNIIFKPQPGRGSPDEYGMRCFGLRAGTRLAGTVLASAAVGCLGDLELPCRAELRCRPCNETACDEGSARQLSVATWNIEWFQHPDRGPVDDALQFERALEVLDQVSADLVALQEISDAARFDELLERRPDYGGVVTQHAWPQQLALLYRKRELELASTGAIVGLDDAGRPPLAVELAHVTGGRCLVVVVHAKAGNAPADRARRRAFAEGLAQELGEWAGEWPRIVLGDFNDQLADTGRSGQTSPYDVLLADTGLVAPTASLEATAESSTVWGDTVDHVLVDPAWLEAPTAGDVDVLRDELLARNPRHAEEVSDHFPVRVRLSAPRARESR